MKIALLDDFHPLISETIKEWDWELLSAQNWSENDFRKKSHDIDGLIIRSSIPLNSHNLSFAKQLKFIGRPGAGLENIDLKYCQDKNIIVFRSPEGNRDAVAEHTIGMLLSLMNHLPKIDRDVRNGIWERESNRGIELKGKVFAIIGYGYMGEAVAQRLKGFGVEVIAYDKYISDFSSQFVEEVTLNDVFQRADIVSLHTPLSEETIGMVDASFLDKFKKSIIVINTARGKSLTLTALLDGLIKGKVKGACLDVLELESSSFEQTSIRDNPVFQSLSKMQNVIFSPHVAGWTEESKLKMAQVIIEKIQMYFK